MKNKLLKIGIAVSPLLFLLAGAAQVQADDHPYGWSPQVDFSNQGPPSCSDSAPEKPPILLQPNHPALPVKPKKPGDIVLFWHKVPSASGYNVYYGLSKKNYIFSAPNIGDTNNFTISYLQNRIYYFAVQAKKGCAASAMSNEWAARPGMGGFSSGNALGVAVRRKTVTPVNKVTPPSTETVVLPTAVPSNPPSVQGVQTGPSDQGSNYQPPQYNPPQAPQAAVPVAPKPKSFWQSILSILFGK